MNKPTVGQKIYTASISRGVYDPGKPAIEDYNGKMVNVEFTEYEITKVGRIYFYVSLNGRQTNGKYPIDRFDYHFYTSTDAYWGNQEALKIAENLRRVFDYTAGVVRKLSLEKLKAIQAIIDEK